VGRRSPRAHRKQVDVPLSEGEHKTNIAITLDSTVTITGRSSR
jgi:hypothetical protein